MQRQVSGDAICGLLGKSSEDALVRDFLSALKADAVTDEIDDETYVSYSSLGLALLFDSEKRLATAYLYSEGRDDFSAFIGTLPGGLSFESDRSGVRSALGSVEASSSSPGAWDRFEYRGGLMHVEYGPSGKVSLVTLMTRERAP